MQRFQTLFKIVLVAAVMMVAAGTPVAAKPTAKNGASVVRVEKKKSFLSTFFLNVRSKLSRYAMAAN